MAADEKYEYLTREDLARELERVISENDQLKELITDILKMLEKKFK